MPTSFRCTLPTCQTLDQRLVARLKDSIRGCIQKRCNRSKHDKCMPCSLRKGYSKPPQGAHPRCLICTVADAVVYCFEYVCRIKLTLLHSCSPCVQTNGRMAAAVVSAQSQYQAELLARERQEAEAAAKERARAAALRVHMEQVRAARPFPHQAGPCPRVSNGGC